MRAKIEGDAFAVHGVHQRLEAACEVADEGHVAGAVVADGEVVHFELDDLGPSRNRLAELHAEIEHDTREDHNVGLFQGLAPRAVE